MAEAGAMIECPVFRQCLDDSRHPPDMMVVPFDSSGTSIIQARIVWSRAYGTG